MGPVVLEKTIVFSFPNFKTMEANSLRGGADLDPKDMVCKLSLGEYMTFLYILSSEPHGFREDVF